MRKFRNLSVLGCLATAVMTVSACPGNALAQSANPADPAQQLLQAVADDNIASVRNLLDHALPAAPAKQNADF